MRRLKKFIIFLFFLTVITVGVIFYLNTIFFPLQAKDFIVKKASILLHRDVFIEKMIFNPAKGIILKNIRITEKKNSPVSFLTIQEASVKIPLPDIFWTGYINIPAISLTNPQINLQSNSAGEWNFSDLLKNSSAKKSPAAKPAKSPRFLISTINIIDGIISLADHTESKTLTHINSTLQMDYLYSVAFDLNLMIPEDSTEVKTRGRYITVNRELTASIKAKNANIPPLLNILKIPLWVNFKQCFLTATDLDLKFKNKELTLDGSLNGQVDMTLTETTTPVQIKTSLHSDFFQFNRKGPQFTLKGSFFAPNTELKIDQNQFKGFYKGTSILVIRNGTTVDMRGNLFGENTNIQFYGYEFSGHPQIENIVFHRESQKTSISGQAKTTNSTLQNPTLDFKTAFASAAFGFQKEQSDIRLNLQGVDAEGVKCLYAQKVIEGKFKSQQFAVNFINHLLQIDGKIKSQNLRLAMGRNFTLLGSPDLEITITKNNTPDTAEAFLSYTGVLTLNNDTLDGVPKFNEATHLTGKINFNNDTAQTKGLAVELQGFPWIITAKVNNYQHPAISISGQSKEMNLDFIKEFFTRKMKYQNTGITGMANDVVISYEGLIFSQHPPDFSAAGTLKSAELFFDKLPQKIVNINGRVEYKAGGLSWKNLDFTYAGQPFQSTGSLKNFAEPVFSTSLATQNLTLTTAGSTNDRIVTLSKLKGHYLSSAFDLSGTISFRNDPAETHLNGTITANLSDLPQLPSNYTFSKTAAATGTINFKGDYSWIGAQWENMKIEAAVNSEKITFSHFIFSQISGNLRSRNDKRYNLNLSSHVFDGKATTDSIVSMDPSHPSEITIDVTGLDLKKFKNNLPTLKAKALSGNLSINSKFSGQLNKPQTWQGSGAFLIKDGQLLEIELLKGIWKVIFNNLLVDEYKHFSFTQANANFSIEKGRISTKDLLLKSIPVDLSMAGWVGFDSQINFDVVANVRQTPVVNSEAMKAVPSTIITQVAKNVVGIKLTGSLSSPKTKYKILPMKVLKKTTDSVFLGIQGMMEDLLQ